MKVGTVETTYRVTVMASPEDSREVMAQLSIYLDNQIVLDPTDPIGLVGVEWNNDGMVTLIFRKSSVGCTSMKGARRFTKSFLQDFSEMTPMPTQKCSKCGVELSPDGLCHDCE